MNTSKKSITPLKTECGQTCLSFQDLIPLLLEAETHYLFLVKCLELDSREKAEGLIDEGSQFVESRTGKGLQLDGADLSDKDMTRLNLRRANFNRANLQRTRFDFSNLTGASLISSSLDSTSFRHSNLETAFLHAVAAQVCDFTGTLLRGCVDAVGSLFHGCTLKGAVLNEFNGASSSFFQCEFSDCVLDSARLSGAKFDECIFEGCKFGNADLSGTLFRRSAISKSDFDSALLKTVTFDMCLQISQVSMRGSHISHAHFNSCSLVDMDLSGCVACSSIFQSCTIDAVTLQRADLSYSSFSNCTFRDVSFEHSVSRATRFTKCHGKNTSFVNGLLEDAHFLECILPGANFTESSARGAIFRNCNLNNANFGDAHLYRAVFSGDPVRAMCLRGANFARANLVHGSIAGDCMEVNLSSAFMAYTQLSQCDFSRANFQGAQLFFATATKARFFESNLSFAAGPYLFLRCQGLPELTSGGRKSDQTSDHALRLCEDLHSLLEGAPRTHM